MRGGGGLEFLIAVVVFLVAIGGVAVPAHCRRQPLMEAAGSNSTSAEESKLHLVFCIEEVCPAGDRGAAASGIITSREHACYCCQQPPMSVCYQSELECREHCQHCDPKCQLQLQASLLGSEN
ncbi:uncharacterized protein C2845_PM13G23990 [Panicum miliaceum]|uniref:Uncharacterized protein n=1 Tax=Panicum miliaceum TaxID=4540 RepID=A0A3L6RJ93_PANMI|nr:uncharacterized protein C2845_PM13G23990 [Panicum miliaceum]